ncbi:MAG: AmmeMemoRadiSam system protein B [Candidatus Omnitrophica bacterium]|nr:AmmeMemoRadiSam system protein B [Candidatus Omnitrophota bacterium]
MSGKFYPQSARSLNEQIAGFVNGNPAKTSALGAIIPHAGYIYSGRVAAQTLSRIIPRKKVVILGPNHSGLGGPFSIFNQGNWRTPLGEVAVDEDLAAKLLDRCGQLSADMLAHQFEHSIEVILPFLQYFFKEFTVIPITCQSQGLAAYQKLAGDMAHVLKYEKDTLIIASSDMTHYEPDSLARKKDRQAIESIVRLDEEELIKKTKTQHITMCGTATVPIMLALTKQLGASKAEVVLYETSAAASGDTSSVVGYLGAIIS